MNSVLKFFIPVFFFVSLISCVEDKLYVSPDDNSENTPTNDLVINEIFANGDGSSNSDWIEIYNNSENEVDISGFSIYDDGIKKGAKAKRMIPNSTIITAKGFIIINTDIEHNESVLFGLNTSSDAVYLENKEGLVLSKIEWSDIILNGTDLKNGKSYGCKPDGSKSLTIFASPTKGSSNNKTE